MSIVYYTKDGKFESDGNSIPWRKIHRVDGPAITDSFGTKQWWQNGEKHRLDGPAVIYNLITTCPYNRVKWYINGKELNKKEVETWIKNNNINLKTKQHQALFMLRFG